MRFKRRASREGFARTVRSGGIKALSRAPESSSTARTEAKERRKMANQNTEFSQRLKMLMTQLNISSAQLAKALIVDPSLVSRWLRSGCGERKASQHALEIGRYVTGRILSAENRAWLCATLARTEGAGITAERIALWLYPNASLPARPAETDAGFANLLVLDSFRNAVTGQEPPAPPQNEHLPILSVCRGAEQISALLLSELQQAAPETEVDIFLSSEAVASAVDKRIFHAIYQPAREKRLNLRMLVQSANNSAMSSRLVGVYIPLLVLGRLRLCVVQGTPQTFTANMNLIIRGQSAVMISEAVQKKSAAVATTVREPEIIQDMRDNFETTLRFARPMMTAYDDSFARNIIEAFFEEYGVPGSLDVIKSGLNPMYMTTAQYGAVLKKFGQKGDQYDWRYQEFTRFQEAMNTVLGNSRFREVLSLPKLNEIAETGCCRMPSMYFMDTGVWHIDAEDCVETLNGYLRYLEAYPNFQVVLLDDESLFMENSCWHIKNNKHVMIHSWNIDNPIMVYSDQLLLIDEFQRHFDNLWAWVNTTGASKRLAIEQLTAIRDRCAQHLTGGAR